MTQIPCCWLRRPVWFKLNQFFTCVSNLCTYISVFLHPHGFHKNNLPQHSYSFAPWTASSGYCPVWPSFSPRIDSITHSYPGRRRLNFLADIWAVGPAHLRNSCPVSLAIWENSVLQHIQIHSSRTVSLVGLDGSRMDGCCLDISLDALFMVSRGQPYTFPLLWFGYIVVINALLFARTGQCLLMNQPKILFKLFLLSAVFWWIFEYLNQFVQNWHYVGMTDVQGVTTVFWMTLSFSTVLPAVLGTYEYLASFTQVKAPVENWFVIPTVDSSRTGWLMFSLGCFGLLMIGIWPTLLYSLLWVSPFSDHGRNTNNTEGSYHSVTIDSRKLESCGSFRSGSSGLWRILGNVECPQPGPLGIFDSLCPRPPDRGNADPWLCRLFAVWPGMSDGRRLFSGKPETLGRDLWGKL